MWSGRGKQTSAEGLMRGRSKHLVSERETRGCEHPATVPNVRERTLILAAAAGFEMSSACWPAPHDSTRRETYFHLTEYKKLFPGPHPLSRDTCLRRWACADNSWFHDFGQCPGLLFMRSLFVGLFLQNTKVLFIQSLERYLVLAQLSHLSPFRVRPALEWNYKRGQQSNQDRSWHKQYVDQTLTRFVQIFTRQTCSNLGLYLSGCPALIMSRRYANRNRNLVKHLKPYLGQKGSKGMD